MNDDPSDRSMAVALGAQRKLENVKPGGLFNPFWDIHADGKGTLTYDGKWNLFDQIILSYSLLTPQNVKDYSTLKYYQAQIFRRDYLFQQEGRHKGNLLRTHAGSVWQDGYSDHLPTLVYLIKEKNEALEKVEKSQPSSSSSQAKSSTSSSSSGQVHDVVEQMPQFPGGQSALFQFFSQNIHYPEICEKKGIQGRVICSCVVDTDGSITDVQVKQSVDPNLDREAVRVIQSMPKWTPGKENGLPVRVRYTIPITFRLQ
jgi:TonB family protein